MKPGTSRSWRILAARTRKTSRKRPSSSWVASASGYRYPRRLNQGVIEQTVELLADLVLEGEIGRYRRSRAAGRESGLMFFAQENGIRRPNVGILGEDGGNLVEAEDPQLVRLPGVSIYDPNRDAVFAYDENIGRYPRAPR